MTIRSVVAIAALACAGGCSKKDAKQAPAPGSAAPVAAVAADADAGSAAGGAGSGSSSGSAVAVGAVDPWNSIPASADATLGAKCGDKLSKVDPWAGSPTPPATSGDKVDVSTIEKAAEDDSVKIGTLGDAKATGFSVIYNPAKNPNHETYRELFVTNRMIDQTAEGLNRTIRLPRVIDINTVSCNTINAFYDPSTKRIIVCYELLDYFVGMFKPTAKDNAELGNAVMGATMFGLFHEIGHGLIDVLELPAVGREEDSVDQLATLTLIASGDEGVAMALAGAYWFQLQSKGGHETPFWDEHAFDQQRFYNITCLIFGSDPSKHGDLVRSGALPWDRAKRCPEEYARVKKSWEKLLQPHMTNAAALNISYKPSVAVAEAPKTTSTDPWGGTAQNTPGPTPPATPAEPPAPGEGSAGSASEGSAAPPVAVHAIPCEQVAEKAGALIRAEAEGRARKMSQAELDELRGKLETELPAAIEQILALCAKEQWTDVARKCVLEAKTLAQATKCE